MGIFSHQVLDKPNMQYSCNRTAHILKTIKPICLSFHILLQIQNDNSCFSALLSFFFDKSFFVSLFLLVVFVSIFTIATTEHSLLLKIYKMLKKLQPEVPEHWPWLFQPLLNYEHKPIEYVQNTDLTQNVLWLLNQKYNRWKIECLVLFRCLTLLQVVLYISITRISADFAGTNLHL